MDERFFAIVTARAPRVERAAEWIAAPDPVRRLEVHASMWRTRLYDALAQDYPAVRAMLGDARFFERMSEYLEAFPSRSPTLHDIGASMPRFLAERENNALADLAALERARNLAAAAADGAVVSFEELATASRLALAPSAQILGLDHDPIEAWRVADRGEQPRAPAPGRTLVLVWRGPSFLVRHRAIDAREAAALRALPSDLAGLCAVIAANEPDVERAAGAARVAIEQWLADALLVHAEK